MKIVINLSIFLLLFSLTACGVSEETKKRMQTASHVALSDGFGTEVELTSVRKGTLPGTDSYYIADFICEFDRSLTDKTKVQLRGSIGFNDYGVMAKVLESNRKLPIVLTSVTVDGDSVSLKDSQYNKPRYLSSNIKVESVSYSEKDRIKDKQSEAVSQLKSWGAKDAYISSDKYLVYVAEESSITGRPNDIAKLWFDMFEDVPGLKGFRVVSASSKKTIGEYSIH